MRRIIIPFLLSTFAFSVFATQANLPQAHTNSISSQSTSFTPQQKKEIEQTVHDYLLENPQLIVEVIQQLQKKQQQEMMQKSNKAVKENFQNLFHANSPSLGDPKAKVTLVEFFDYQCPHCKDLAPVVTDIVTKNPNVRVIFKEFPIFPNSDIIAKAALAANKQGKYQEFHDALMAANGSMDFNQIIKIAGDKGLNIDQLKKDMNDPTIKTELNDNMKLGNNLGIMGTPSFVIATNINSKDKLYSVFIPGGVPESILKSEIAKVAEHSKS